MTSLLGVFLLLLTLAIFSFVSHRKKLLTFEGIMLGNIVGLIAFLGGNLHAFITLLIFFTAAEIFTLMPKGKQKHAQRTASNILGNGGPAVIAIFFGSLTAFYGAIAGALADTLSSEIGLTSRKKPVMITDLKKEVEPGTDGAITRRGLFAALFGALLISIAVFYKYPDINLFIIITIAGICGSLVDSALGALFEAKGSLDNTSVNFLASGCAAIVAYIGSILLGIRI